MYKHCVALRKESVDRNDWRAAYNKGIRVALRKESVDRNMASPMRMIVGKGRSPQGERG